ncbi:ABC transporter permease [Microbacterium telephonicum]|uniref:Transport permease protein n=1 Tax=Microbacterium telephonicum TaxID=1714841 RepID=A0A498CBJ8_9MICO|nr:ABC transporter permease [Microbacterium telephonicum]RLK53005.1 ABC-2 family transporter [Microbacterium telephonicum]
MRVVAGLVGRNLRLFFRDRLNVFFSMLSGLILFFLYTLFLARLQVDGLAETLPQASPSDIEAFVASWMLSGIVLLTTVTAGIGALSSLVDDRATGRFADFLVAPIRRTHLVLGYLLSAIAVAVIMSTIILVLTVLYLGFVHGTWIAPVDILAALAAMLLCCAAFTALAAFGASFLRTAGAYSAFATVVGTILGFVAGAYIPVGSLPPGVASTINALPFAQGAMLMRRPFTHETLAAVSGGVPQAESSLATFYGVDIFVGDAQVSGWVAVLVLAVMAVGFTALAAGRVRSLLR